MDDNEDGEIIVASTGISTIKNKKVHDKVSNKVVDKVSNKVVDKVSNKVVDKEGKKSRNCT